MSYARGPDGIPIKLFKVCPVIFGRFLYKIIKAAARLLRVSKHWELSILIPFFIGKQFFRRLEGYRPLSLIILFKKIHEMKANLTLERDGRKVLEKFNFEKHKASLGATARMLARVRTRRVISLFIVLTRTNYLVIRQMVMEFVRQKYRTDIAGLVPQLKVRLWPPLYPRYNLE